MAEADNLYGPEHYQTQMRVTLTRRTAILQEMYDFCEAILAGLDYSASAHQLAKDMLDILRPAWEKEHAREP